MRVARLLLVIQLVYLSSQQRMVHELGLLNAKRTCQLFDVAMRSR